MVRKLTLSLVAILAFACMSFAAGKAFYGVVSDSNCGLKHSTASAAAAKCIAGCVAKGASYVLVSHGKIYKLDPQDKFADAAGKRVKVTGSLSGDTITAETVTPLAGHKMKM